MAKSSTSARRRKPVQKPKRPYDGFPLFPHASGRWARKLGTRIHYFGRWATTVGGKLVVSADTDATAAQAMRRFEHEWPYLKEGKTPPPMPAEGEAAPTWFKMIDLCDGFLQDKLSKVESGELSLHSFAAYRTATDALMDHFGRNRRVDDLKPVDFEKFRAALAKGVNVVTLKSKINRIRVVLAWASDTRRIDHPVDFGSAFDRPSTKSIRQARYEAGERMLEAAEIRALLSKADPTMKAAILLGVNGGLGNTDIARLPRKAVDLESGWLTFPRPKTAIVRRIPLWVETVAAMRVALSLRPAAKDKADDDACFLTSRGTRFVRVQETRTGKHATINALARRFEALMEAAGIEGRKGVGFYTLRHVTETIGGNCRDQVAVDAIMGHADQSMGANYRQRIDDDRLLSVVNTVRSWLYAGTEGGAQ